MLTSGRVRPFDPENPPVPTAESRAAARQWMDDLRARIAQQDALQDAQFAALLNRPLSPLRKLPVITWITPGPLPPAYWPAAPFVPGKARPRRIFRDRGRIIRPDEFHGTVNLELMFDR